MTKLNKPVTRSSETVIRDGGKLRQLVVTLYPGDVLGLRPAGTRRKREEQISLAACYSLAVKQRVAAELREKKQQKKGRRRA